MKFIANKPPIVPTESASFSGALYSRPIAYRATSPPTKYT
ncbi:hypothetical protein A2U01_0075796, partial [Trifolium medium]|nr:hypothetical protein [Trifolium medium]